MRRIILQLALALSTAGLAACSSTTQVQRTEINREYVAQVEAATRHRTQNVRVHWVNPPTKKTTVTDDTQR